MITKIISNMPLGQERAISEHNLMRANMEITETTATTVTAIGTVEQWAIVSIVPSAVITEL